MVRDKIKELVDSKKLRSETPTDNGSDLELERGESNMKVTSGQSLTTFTL